MFDNLTAADLISDLNEPPGVAAEAELDPLDLFWLDWLGQP